MRMEKQVSVIVPVYNAENFLESCINSILASSYRRLQVILINDGSTDGSAGICDQYAQRDTRIVVRHQNNLGIVAARNAGLQLATGDYISFVDADDQISPIFYEEMVSAMESEKADIVACEYRNNLGDIACETYPGKEICKVVMKTFEDQLAVLTCAPSIRSITWTGPYVWNKLYRAQKITEWFQKECLMCEDLRFNYTYLKSCCKMVIVQEGLYFYRIHDESITGVYRKKRGSAANGVANAELWSYIAKNARCVSDALQNYLDARAAYTAHGALWRVYLSRSEKQYGDFVGQARKLIRKYCKLLCSDRETYGIHVICAVWSCAHIFFVWKMIVRCSIFLN